MMIDIHEYRESLKRIATFIPKNKKFLITGATGLIGSCLVDALLFANDFYKCCCDIYIVGRNKDKMLERFETNKFLHYIVQDITLPIELNCQLDYIIHAASLADPKSYSLYPAETILTNVYGTKNVLELCKNSNCRVFISSTFEVYGRHEDDIYFESDFCSLNFNELRSCYPESKRVSELLLKSYISEYNVDGVIGRFSSVYGPTMLKNDSKAHAQFLKNALNGEDIVLKSKGEQVRNYTYVIDACLGIFYVLFKGVTGEAYNVASKSSISSIYNVAKTISDLCDLKIVFDNPDEIEKKGFSKPQNCILDTTKITELGFEPLYDLKNGMLETINILKKIN